MRKFKIILSCLFVLFISACGTPHTVTFYGVKDITISINSSFDPLDGVRAIDRELGEITDIEVTGTVDTTKIGDYTITYTVTNYQGNKVSKDRKVSVVEITGVKDLLLDVSDYATTDKDDQLKMKFEGVDITWKSSKPELYSISDGVGKVIKKNQGRKEEKVKISISGKNEDNLSFYHEKEITVAPIKMADLPKKPVATYFSTGPMSTFKSYSARYKEEGTIFSDTTKEVLNIVYYAFANITADGKVSIDDGSYLNEVKELRNYDTRVVICISGVSQGSAYFASLTEREQTRKEFVNNMMDLVEEYQFDGIDIDWESTSSSLVIASRMNALMKDIRAEMDSRRDEAATPYYLSCAVPASSWGAGPDRFDFATLNNYVDYINLMSYDMNKGDTCSHLSPLYPSQKDKGYKFGVVYGVNLLVNRGFPKEKIIIGASG